MLATMNANKIESLKLMNVFGLVTVWPGRLNALAVSVRPDRRSVEKMLARDIAPVEGLQGAHQLLFGANLRTGRPPEIAVFQIRGERADEPDLFANPDVRAALNEVIGMVRQALE